MRNADALRKALTAPRPRSGRAGSRGGEHVYRINLQWRARTRGALWEEP